MKTTLIIIAYTLLLIGGLATAAILNLAKPEVKSKNFVGIDAAGFKHYPDGHTERMEIKFK
ncbi:UNVERIFIED_CONTAM: hypothetical protein POZ17_19755 [Ralstonia mannitolilytica]